ncbi:MAG: preprotein translocase subunit SecG [Muribaculaceae bacterium]|jgi:preprotein translocase subunit SecG|nr:preprotein translocase subunit SecG [Bacteroidales bacterium]MBQ1486249.1 preprotein translocase subunit SecG [Muribaculaceae bacterium]
MYTIFAILIVIASILLVGVILIQKSKGGGLAANVNNYNQFMGVRKTTDFVEKATWGLSIFICALSIASAFVTAPSIVEGAPQIKKLPTSETQAPNFGTQAEQAPAASQSKAVTVPAKVEVPAKEEAPAAPAKEAGK